MQPIISLKVILECQGESPQSAHLTISSSFVCKWPTEDAISATGLSSAIEAFGLSSATKAFGLSSAIEVFGLSSAIDAFATDESSCGASASGAAGDDDDPRHCKSERNTLVHQQTPCFLPAPEMKHPPQQQQLTEHRIHFSSFGRDPIIPQTFVELNRTQFNSAGG